VIRLHLAQWEESLLNRNSQHFYEAKPLDHGRGRDWALNFSHWNLGRWCRQGEVAAPGNTNQVRLNSDIHHGTRLLFEHESVLMLCWDSHQDN
jgi:hypothetical protein